MGFGGGSHGGGGHHHHGGHYYHRHYDRDYYSYGSSGSGKCTKGDCIGGVGCLFALVAFIGLFTPYWLLHGDSLIDHVLCANGTSLNSEEQMWCRPPVNFTNVTAELDSGVKLYRFNNESAPGFIERHSQMSISTTLDSNKYKYYSFVMNPGSNLSAHLKSTAPVSCFLLDNANMDIFVHEGYFSTIYSGIGELVVDSFRPNVSDDFFFVFSDTSDSRSGMTIEFDIDFYFKVYDVSQLKPVCEGLKTCKFEDIKEDEIIIADNNGGKELEVSLILYDKINMRALIIWSAFAACAIVFIVGLGVGIYGQQLKKKQKQLESSEKSSLVGSSNQSSYQPSYQSSYQSSYQPATASAPSAPTPNDPSISITSSDYKPFSGVDYFSSQPSTYGQAPSYGP